MRCYKKVLQYQLSISIFISLFVFPAYSINSPVVNDSLIEMNIWNANFENALKLINQFRQQHATDNNKSTLLLLKTCDIYLRLGNHDAAGKVIADVEKAMSGVKNPGHELQFHYAFQKGRYFNFTGKYTDALNWLRHAEYQAKYIVDIDHRAVSNLYGELGAYYGQKNEYPSSVSYYQLAIATLRGELPQDKIMTTYYQACLSNAYWYNNEPEKAEVLIKSCLNFLNTVTEPLHPALIDTYLAITYYCLNANNDIAVSDKLLRNATMILNKSYPSDHYMFGILYYLKSETEYYKNDFENALLYSNHALNITNVYPSLLPYRIYNYTVIARIYFLYKHDYKRTISYCNIAITNIRGTNQSPAYFYYLIGLSYNILKDEQLARTFLDKVIHVALTSSSSEDYYISSLAYLKIANIYRFSNKPELARYYLKKALETSLNISLRNSNIPVIYRELGRTYYMTGEYRKALNAIQQSIISGCRTFSDTSILANPAIADIQTIYPLIEAFSLKAYLLYKLYETEKYNKKLNYLKSALDCQELSVKITERTVIGIDDENSGLTLVSLKKTVLDNAASYATLLYLRTNNRQYAEKAFGYAEKSKMQVLLMNTMKKSNLHNSGVPDSLINKEETLDHKILEIENRLALDEKGIRLPGYIETLLKKLAGLYDRRDELTNQLEEEYPAYYKSKYSFNVAGIDKIQQMLNDDQVILEYQLLNTEIITFVITRENFSIHYQLIDNKVRDNIQQLRNTLAVDPTRSEQNNTIQYFTGPSYYLYKKLIEPVYDKIRNKHLIIIPHNELTQIPFEVLISKMPEVNQQSNYKSLNYLIKEFPIVYAYSANLLLDQNQGKKFGTGTAIFLPDYSSYSGGKKQFMLPVLKGAATEAATIRKISHGRLFKGSLACETTFKTKANGYRVLHIASHTHLDEKNPALSCLIMTAPSDSVEDGYLYSYELSQLNLNAQLVVLSGCNTGFGILRKSEGLISLARSFFYTGVRTVMFTLWPVADNAGAAIISSFYKGLKHRKQLDDALRESKLKFLEKADPVKAHPFFWAGYVIVGKTNHVHLRRYGLWPEIIVISLIISMIAFFLYSRFRV